MFDMVASVAARYPNYVAFDFMGKSTTYARMIRKIEQCAQALKTIGIRKGDCVTIAMPNCPQAIYMFYAINLIGGIASMVHPLSSEKEIEFYLNESNSITVITLDQFYGKIEAIRKNTGIVNVILARIKDELAQPLKAGYMITEGYKIAKIPKDAPVITWKNFMKLSKCCFYNYKVERSDDDPAVILYSGGTTGTTKGIMLTNRNFNALAEQVIATNPMFGPGDKMLAAMPVFHGFGLGVCIHTMLAKGGSAQYGEGRFLPPQGRVLRRRLPVHRAQEEDGQVPRRPQGHHQGARGLRYHRVRHRLLPDSGQAPERGQHRHTFPRHLFQDSQARYGGGNAWDLGCMDDQGFVYFRGRIKRMIVTSGYNVYPAQLENILDAHEKVQMSCIIGVPDPYKMQKVKAFVMLRPGNEPTQETKDELLAYCRKYIAKYAMPYDIEFRSELPKTLVGKVAYRVLEEEEARKNQAADQK